MNVSLQAVETGEPFVALSSRYPPEQNPDLESQLSWTCSLFIDKLNEVA